jgi:hypothetical protein
MQEALAVTASDKNLSSFGSLHAIICSAIFINCALVSKTAITLSRSSREMYVSNLDRVKTSTHSAIVSS